MLVYRCQPSSCGTIVGPSRILTRKGPEMIQVAPSYFSVTMLEDKHLHRVIPEVGLHLAEGQLAQSACEAAKSMMACYPDWQ